MKYALLLVMAYLVCACTITMSVKFAEREAPAISKESKNARYKHEERGNRGDFVRANVCMSPKMLCRLKKLGAVLQESGEKDTDISSLMREACEGFLVEMEKHLGIMK